MFGILASGMATTASAQIWLTDARQRSCFDTLSTSAMFRVPVYLTASLHDSTMRWLGNDADFVAQSVAERIRAMLATHPDTLPFGEPRVTWVGIDVSLPITVYRKRPLVYDTAAIGDSVTPAKERAGARLIAEALDAVRAKEEPFFLWPDSQGVDSARFSLVLTRPAVTPEGRSKPVELPNPRVRFLVFSVLTPWQLEAIAERGNPSPKYPSRARNRGAGATVNLQFVIETNGRVAPETIKHLWPARIPPLTGDRAELYASFVESARQAALTSRFKPAKIGGCPVKVIVVQPYEFAIGK